MPSTHPACGPRSRPEGVAPPATSAGLRGRRLPAVLLGATLLAGLPAAADAQDVAPAPKLVAPLTAPCYSAALGSSRGDRPTIPSIGISGGSPGRRLLVTSGNPDTSAYEASGTVKGSVGGRGIFDANGAATIAPLELGRFVPIGPGRQFLLTVYDAGAADRGSDNGDGVRTPETSLATVTGAALGAEVTKLDGNRNGSVRPGDKRRLVVSGAPFAGKTLYGHLVKGGKRVLERFKLGTAGTCGHLERAMVTWPVRHKNVPSLKIYVTIGPTFDKARAVKTGGV